MHICQMLEPIPIEIKSQDAMKAIISVTPQKPGVGTNAANVYKIHPEVPVHCFRM